MPRPRLAVVGYASIDEILLPGSEPLRTIGGGAVYAALSAASLGVAACLHVAIGEDFPDAWLRELERLGIDVGAVERRPGPTRRTRLTYDAGEERLSSAARDADWWSRTEALLPPLPAGGFDAILVCPAPLPIVRDVIRGAQGAFVVADTSEAFAAEGRQALAAFAGVDLFAPSLDELHRLSGQAYEAAAIERVAAAVKVLVVKKGRRGLSRIDAAGIIDHAPQPVSAVDPTGAGDATVGALAAAVLLGQSPERQLSTAAAAGRRAIGAVGPGAFGWCA